MSPPQLHQSALPSTRITLCISHLSEPHTTQLLTGVALFNKMWVTRNRVGVFVIFNVVTFSMFLPVTPTVPNDTTSHQSNHLQRPAAEHDLLVHFIFLPPTSTIVAPSMERNGSFMLFGLDGYVLHILCERLQRRAILYTDTDPITLEFMYSGYKRFGKIGNIHRRAFSDNVVDVMNSR